MTDSIEVSSAQVAVFLREAVAAPTRRLRDSVEYLALASSSALAKLDIGQLPAWVLNHQTPNDLWQAEGALRQAFLLWSAIPHTEEDDEAFRSMLINPDQRWMIAVRGADA